MSSSVEADLPGGVRAGTATFPRGTESTAAWEPGTPGRAADADVPGAGLGAMGSALV
jgi:hypothetical protein